MAKPLFRTGRVIATAAAVKAMLDAGQDPNRLLDRHTTGDWGNVPDEVREANELSSRSFFTTKRPRIFSAYALSSGRKVLVYTESDRSVTTILLPEEYQLADTQAVGPMVQLDRSSTRKLDATSPD